MSHAGQSLQIWFSPATKHTGQKGGNSKEVTRCVCLLQVKLQLVGCDAILLVEGRELVYFKLLDVDAFLSAAPPGARLLPGDAKLSLALNAGDVALRDLQVRDSGKPHDWHMWHRGDLGCCFPAWNFTRMFTVKNVHCYACSTVVHTNRRSPVLFSRPPLYSAYQRTSAAEPGIKHMPNRLALAPMPVDVSSCSSRAADKLALAHTHYNNRLTSQTLRIDVRMSCHLQARPEHSNVLRPNTAGKYMEVRLSVTVPASGPPQLALEVSSPRILLLQRFVLDILYAVKLFLVRGSALTVASRC